MSKPMASMKKFSKLLQGKSKSGGRNSLGRTTIWHRGGGAKRLQRTVDLKRSTSSVGVIERVEYDPNRSSRLALVRWTEGVPRPPSRRKKCSNTIGGELALPDKILEPTTIQGPFLFSSLPGIQKADKEKMACSSPTGLMASYAVIGLPSPTSKSPLTSTKGEVGRKHTCAKDVFFSALSSSPRGHTGETASSGSLNSSFVKLPRMAVAGARPAFFAPRRRDDKLGGAENNELSLSKIQKWRTDSTIWAHRVKRKAAVSWQSFRPQQTLGGTVGGAKT